MGNGRTPPVPDDPGSKSGSFDILDALVVVSTALFLLLFVFWLAGVINGTQAVETLPGWLSNTAKTLKAAIGAIGTTVVVQIIRARLGRKTNPQYLAWILGVFAVLLLSTCVAAKISAKPATPQSGAATSAYSTALVHFATLYPAGSNILFVHHYHTKMEEKLTDQSKPDAKAAGYLAHIDLPSDLTTQFDATFGELITKSHGYQPSQQAGGYFDMCLQRAPGDHGALNEINLKCEDQDCSIDSEKDKGLAVSCGAGEQTSRESDSPGSFFSFISTRPVLAAGIPASNDHAIHSSLPYWTVPTLDTLNAMDGSERAGYTRFDMELTPSAALRSTNSDSYQFQVFVNGQAIYFNGFPPQAFRTPFDAASPMRLSFALENLSFSGADNGYENLTVVFTFFKGQTQTLQQPVSRKYVALRCVGPVTVDSAVGSFQWSGTYIPAAHENTQEVLVNSVQKVDDAMQVKTAYGDGHVYRDPQSGASTPVVLVIRPPLRRPWYGLAIGLVQPSGQIQFTFTQQEASVIYNWAKQERTHTPLFRSDLHIEAVQINAFTTCK